MSDWTSEAEARRAAPNDSLLAEAVAEIERLRAEDARMHASVAHWEREFTKAQEAVDYANQRWDSEHDRAEAAEAKLAILREQLTERDVALDRAVLKLAEMEADKHKAFVAATEADEDRISAEEDLAAERAKTAEAVERQLQFLKDLRAAEARIAKLTEEESYWRHEVVSKRLCGHGNPHISHDCVTVVEERLNRNAKLVEALEAIVRHTPRQGFWQAADMRGIASAALAAAKASEEK